MTDSNRTTLQDASELLPDASELLPEQTARLVEDFMADARNELGTLYHPFLMNELQGQASSVANAAISGAQMTTLQISEQLLALAGNRLFSRNERQVARELVPHGLGALGLFVALKSLRYAMAQSRAVMVLEMQLEDLRSRVASLMPATMTYQLTREQEAQAEQATQADQTTLDKPATKD